LDISSSCRRSHGAHTHKSTPTNGRRFNFGCSHQLTHTHTFKNDGSIYDARTKLPHTHKITKRRCTTVQITTLAPGYPHTQLPETTTDDGWCAHTPRDSTTNHKTLKREQGHLLNQTPYCWSMFSKESFLVLIRRHLPGV
jgi:hypothetical protein